jgi:hypothetical protein
MRAGRLSAAGATSLYSLPSLGSALYRRSPTLHELGYKSFVRSPPPTTKERSWRSWFRAAHHFMEFTPRISGSTGY